MLDSLVAVNIEFSNIFSCNVLYCISWESWVFFDCIIIYDLILFEKLF